MVAIAALLATIALIAAALARWTRHHPLAIAALGGVPGVVICMILANGTISRETAMFAVIVFAITAAAAALGAFLGWLRRTNLERNV